MTALLGRHSTYVQATKCVFVFFLQEEVDVFSDVLSEKLQNLFGVFAVTGRGLSCAEQTWSCPGKRRAAGSGMFKSSL